MNRISALLVLTALLPMAFGVEGSYMVGSVIDVQKKANTRVLYYVVNTPVTREDPYYEIQVRVQNTLYTGQYNPRHEDDTLLEDFKPDTQVKARVEKRHLFLKHEGGNDLDLVIVKRAPIEKGKGTGATPANK
jgi:hypothetical protein